MRFELECTCGHAHELLDDRVNQRCNFVKIVDARVKMCDCIVYRPVPEDDWCL